MPNNTCTQQKCKCETFDYVESVFAIFLHAEIRDVYVIYLVQRKIGISAFGIE